VGCSGRGRKLDRPRPSRVRDVHPWPRAHRPPPGLVCTGPGNDVRISIETRFYVTDLTEADASIEHLLRLVRGHWSIESLHWVRDNTFDEDRSQVRTGTLPRVLATLRNLAISIIRHTTYRSVNIAAATRQLARQPDITLDLLGIPPLLCK
jgi:hypothetical protein